jgi:hypothetical protein
VQPTVYVQQHTYDHPCETDTEGHEQGVLKSGIGEKAALKNVFLYAYMKPMESS